MKISLPDKLIKVNNNHLKEIVVESFKSIKILYKATANKEKIQWRNQVIEYNNTMMK